MLVRRTDISVSVEVWGRIRKPIERVFNAVYDPTCR
jgi:hypothetical protein